ncbi:NACHT, LRR and PYD domains-containing protein 1 [Platysternon megacephalum]|uniref:NACHT, LRR and PYD domains-containing protein 1 n=1 Tax=Platysternon megacephalum TaxID=55544 RepID=A0A4D9DN50_9SAUR|nr:NACHT, LRR and PYD domains-containing protein 1 [Platysternon megacephalum]
MGVVGRWPVKQIFLTNEIGRGNLTRQECGSCEYFSLIPPTSPGHCLEEVLSLQGSVPPLGLTIQIFWPPVNVKQTTNLLKSLSASLQNLVLGNGKRTTHSYALGCGYNTPPYICDRYY